MHLFFYARGINNQIELFKTLAQSQFWKWKRFNLKTKKDEFSVVQGALRPSVLGAWEYIFPEEALSEVVSTFGLIKGWEDGFKMGFLRKIFGAKKIPKKIWKQAEKISPVVILSESQRALNKVKVQGVDIHIIGIKKDRRETREDWGYTQEML